MPVTGTVPDRPFEALRFNIQSIPPLEGDPIRSYLFQLTDLYCGYTFERWYDKKSGVQVSDIIIQYVMMYGIPSIIVIEEEQSLFDPETMDMCDYFHINTLKVR